MIRKPVIRSTAVRSALVAAQLAVLALVLACATNPATGKRQLSLISESQEIELGRNADEQYTQQLGLYPNDELQRYVSRLGQELAERSERPELPWSFKVVDDPVVNAFALPGGFIYVTRGILAHLQSEAELVGVLGHEIGHVTARHSVNQMSKAQLAQIGLVAGVVAAPELAQQLGGLAQTGLGLLFLKFGRDDESQADELGVRYMSRTGYPPPALIGVFDMLGRASRVASGGDRLPNWLSTHPDPVNRQQNIARMAEGLPAEVNRAPEREASYLSKIDGLTYGPNPREGFFRGAMFHHPDLAFRMRFPEGWETRNLKQAVIAQSSQQDAVMALTLTGADSPRAAAQQFFRELEQQGVERGGSWVDNRNRLATDSYIFRVVVQGQEQVRGGVAFTEYDGRVYRLLAYAKPDRWSAYDREAGAAVASFGPERDRGILNVKPQRIDLVRIDRAMTLEEFQRRYPSDVSLEKLALLNRVSDDGRLPAGTRVKRVVGDDPST